MRPAWSTFGLKTDASGIFCLKPVSDLSSNNVREKKSFPLNENKKIATLFFFSFDDVHDWGNKKDNPENTSSFEKEYLVFVVFLSDAFTQEYDPPNFNIDNYLGWNGWTAWTMYHHKGLLNQSI